MREDYFKFCFVLMVILVVSLALPSKVFAQSDSDLTPAEQWILEQTENGAIADLSIQFPNKEERVLSANFLKKLLENPDIEITRYGVRIRQAVFNDSLELDYITVDHQLWLENCEFNGSVNLYESRFAGDLSLRSSTFSSGVDLRFSKIGENLVADNTKFLHKEQTANFNSMKVDSSVFLHSASFWGPVEFTAARIGGTFEVEEALFHSVAHRVSFNSIAVDGFVTLKRAKFWGPVDFIRAQIGGNLQAAGARFYNKDEGVSFNSMTVDGSVRLYEKENEAVHETEFAGPVDFVGAQIGGVLEADGVKFTSAEQLANFNSITVDDDVFLSKAEFAGGLDLVGAQIGGVLEADGVKFTSAEQLANFNSITVDGSLFLREKAEFAGPVDFGYAQIGSTLEADDASFKNMQKTVSFNSIQVKGTVFLRRAEFFGPVDFIRASIGSNLEANDARFQNTEQGVQFESLQVDGHIFLNRAVFAGPVNFRFVEVKDNFRANYADFQSMNTPPSFTNMIVRQEASFVGTKFKQGAHFDNAVFLDLTIRAVEPYHNKSGWRLQDPDCKKWGAILAEPKLNLSLLQLSQTVVERKLDLTSLNLQNLDSRSLRVQGPTNITNVYFRNSVDFENSRFGDLTLENVCWPPKADKQGEENINLAGMSYQNIHMILGPNTDAWDRLIGLLDSSAYNAQAYTTLENYFVQQGYADRADEVYIRYKLRERKEGLNLWSNVLLWLVGYGRQPGYVLVGALVFILVGWLLVFRKREGMVPLSTREIVRPNVGHRGTLSRKISKRMIFSQYEGFYSPFLYSLDLFIPFLDLGFDDKWAPRPHRKWAIAYAKLHMLAGWVLIPIGLLAITGVIK